MSNLLSTPGTSLSCRVLKQGQRLFALLGRVTSDGLEPFESDRLTKAWALTAERGCLRLERLTGSEIVTSGQLVLPSAKAYQYGIFGLAASSDLVRSVFGLLPSELEQMVNALRRGNYPMLGFSHKDVQCAITSCTIPGGWPHLVLSNAPENVISLEAFVRILMSSLQAPLSTRPPGLRSVFKAISEVASHRGIGLPYTQQFLKAPELYRS